MANSPTNDSVTSASTTLQMLVDAINAASGGTVQYAFEDNPFIGDDLNGGEPGGNIRNAYLYRVDRGVDYGRARSAPSTPTAPPPPSSAAMRRPTIPSSPRGRLVADFTFNGQTMTIVNNHFSSKSGSGALMGAQPPFVDSTEDARAEQAQAVNTFVDSLLAANSGARVVVSGDLNEFEFEPNGGPPGHGHLSRTVPMPSTLPEYTVGGTAVLDSMADMLPVNERYDYVFEGNSQSLDQMYVTDAGPRQCAVRHRSYQCRVRQPGQRP